MPVSISGTTGYAGPLGAITVDTGSIVANAVTPAKLSRTGTAGQVLTSGGSGADPSYTTLSSGVNVQIFAANGTFTIPAGVSAIKVTVVGGGGGGGGINISTFSAYYAYGGAAGGTAIKYLTGLTSAATLAVTVGDAGTASTGAGGSGGTSSVASGTQSISTISATGGAGGAVGVAHTDVGGPLALTTAGVGSGGDFNNSGGAGAAPSTINAGCQALNCSGGGGGTGGFGGNIQTGNSISGAALGRYGGTGGAPIGRLGGVVAPINGNAATGYGNGGGGAYKQAAGTASGGAGAVGVVIFEW